MLASLSLRLVGQWLYHICRDIKDLQKKETVKARCRSMNRMTDIYPKSIH